MPESRIKGKKKDFTLIYNSVLKDPRLELKTIGLFAIMQSFPDEWEYSISGLAARARIGRDSVRKCLKQLEDAGYLLREQGHQKNGKFACNTYVLQDEAPPCTEKPYTVKPSTEKPLTENQTQVNKHLSNINTPLNPPTGGNAAKKRKSKSAPNWKPERFEKFWSFYRDNARGEDRAGAVREWDRLRPDDELIDTMEKALQAQVATDAWKRGVGIPYACRWLKNERWKDCLRGTASQETAPAPQRRYIGTKVVDGEEVDVYE